MKINCIIIDDEPLARKGLTNFIREIPFLNLVDNFSNPVESIPALKENEIDLIFLDIQMPKIGGLDFLKTLSKAPVTIITTAFPNFALESYELNVMDYLVKPIPFERFVKAVNKAKDYIELQRDFLERKKTNEVYFFIKCENRFEKIYFDDLLFVEALQNYVMLHTTGKKYVSYLTFKSVEEYLPSNRFLKVNKSFIVSLGQIESIEGSEIKISGKTINISRANKTEILNIILKNKLLRK